MPNTNPSKFTRAELADIYEKLVLYYELTQGLEREHLSIRVKGYRPLVDSLALEVKPFSTEQALADVELPQFDSKQNLIWFHDAKNSQLKSLFYHLRNAAAHGDIERHQLRPITYRIEHRYKGKLKLFCIIKKNDFWHFVDAAKNMKGKPKVVRPAVNQQPKLDKEVAE